MTFVNMGNLMNAPQEEFDAFVDAVCNYRGSNSGLRVLLGLYYDLAWTRGALARGRDILDSRQVVVERPGQ